ncbi:DNA polymerase [Pelomonas aquatica]|uniref:Type-4 uracil-DNA glycosylase n=1 Tax=Pelomonas aquatica TaxID=431058 RepID=A0ABU1ZCB1_9BURK|nr:uracil-DNA glycosylase [Pelomonas aquatica]MDR7298270.1 DNA polymerase [Pelomonas aquatica]
MSWDARQRAMLAEMGYRLPAAMASTAVVEDEPEPIAVAAPPPAVMRVAVPPAPAVEPSAVPAHFAALDLPGLRDAVAACRGCGLCEQRRNAVFGGGALQQAQWLVVTDPPDDADDAAGDAFTGDAGRLLDRMLLAAGQRRSGRDDAELPTAFVTPIVKCRPPRGRAPQPAELAACEAVLARQVELLQPRLVLAMGLQAARRLTGLAEPLGRLRGRVHEWRGLPLVVTYHPAYLLRSPADKAGAWDDLCLARKTSNP